MFFKVFKLLCQLHFLIAITSYLNNYKRIILIGDSVDRNAVYDWCNSKDGQFYFVNSPDNGKFLMRHIFF
jgi:hypothetical protein